MKRGKNESEKIKEGKNDDKIVNQTLINLYFLLLTSSYPEQ